MHAKIIGSGSFLPSKVLTNADLEKMVDTTDAWITERTGIKKRHVVSEGETTCDLAEQAALSAMQAAGVAAHELDMIIVATTTPDKIFPSTACLVQQRIGAGGCAAFDVQAVCTGFVYALSIADAYIRSGGVKTALVIGAETMSRIVDWNDRRTCVLFGDGAGAVVLRASEAPGIMSTHLHADGQYEKLLHVPCGISKTQCDEGDGPYVQMLGKEVFKVAVNTLGKIVDETLAANSLKESDIDWLIPHQANNRIINATAKKLKMSLDRVVVTVDRHGNTSAASIPLALDVAIRDERIKPGDLLLLEAFGGGFTWGSALVRY